MVNDLSSPRPDETPAGRPETPDQSPTTDAGEDAPIADRTGRNPANLGGDVADQGDLVHPAPGPDSGPGEL